MDCFVVDFDFQLRKQVSSIYGDNIFTRFIEENGTEYNVCGMGFVSLIIKLFLRSLFILSLMVNR